MGFANILKISRLKILSWKLTQILKKKKLMIIKPKIQHQIFQMTYKAVNQSRMTPQKNQDYENRYETEFNERPKLDSPTPISKNTSNEDFDDYISNLASRRETLKEHVSKQISLELKESKDLLIASVLTDYLEPTGWLSTNIEDIANEINCRADEINSVLVKLQKLEPAGVFARNLSECLKIQLEEKSLLSDGIEILLDNLDLLAKGELRQLIKLTNFTQEEISKSITLIRSLNPKPGV